ncbi:DUF7527 domain-containing protein [Halobellus rubicundus]|uniref:DUF7527 domain-containing protein n=1 Tax=Halobellus rubicundus TaxID=2996466 RepID=A0ABD5MAQ2_9EURY
MNSRTIDVVTEWETVAAPDGYEGLHQLSDSEFSGAVSAGTTWAFFLNGRVVGVFKGEIGDFEDASLTAYRAADPSLPLLFAMQERGGETRAKYYTNETPLSDADKTLESGGFTGYIELSENVLSGDYYVVYHGGKSMSAAFVGSSQRLVTGDEAFEKAADEVGIYEVKDVDIELVDIPELPDGGDAAGDETAESDTSDEDAADGDADEDAAETEPMADRDAAIDDGDEAREDDGSAVDATDADPKPDDGAVAGEDGSGTAESVGDDADEPPNAPAAANRGTDTAAVNDPADAAASAEPADSDTPTTAAEADATADVADADANSDAEADVAADAREPSSTPTDTTTETNAAEATAVDDQRAAPTESDPRSVDGSDRPGGGTAETAAGAEAQAADPSPASDSERDGVFSDEERWREARTIPSLDPGRSNGEASVREGDAQSKSQSQTPERTSTRQRRAREARDRAAARRERRRGQDRNEIDGQDPDRLRKRLSRARERLESLESERDDLAEERDEYRERVEELEAAREKQRERIDELEAERERLESEVERLEAELESQEANASGGGGADAAETETMAPDRALAGTNLFVRYDRKGEATLEHAHDGKASREDVSANLRLEHHTTFETDDLIVADRPYEEFLHDSTEYSFAEWVVSDLLYEIGETGNRSKLGGVFDAIPDIDRIELSGTVDIAGEDGAEERAFDVIFRDKMGDPLFVADINASRNATTEAMVGSLVENTGTLAESDESLAAGFYVTESFYEPGALETVAEATGGGLLSRSNKLSYVKLSRKRGYHLCLVEARNGEFHLNVPDL